MMRPRGNPPTPIAASRLRQFVEMAPMSSCGFSPRRIIEPLPNFFSICKRADSIAFPLSIYDLADGPSIPDFPHLSYRQTESIIKGEVLHVRNRRFLVFFGMSGFKVIGKPNYCKASSESKGRLRVARNRLYSDGQM